jgi:hypothetical protein
MSRSKMLLLVVCLAVLGTTSSAGAASFAVRPVTFASAPGYSMIATGTITTAGNTSTITGWNVTVTTSSRLARFTPGNTANMSYGNLSSDGTHLMVATSPDGFQDGGLLYFRSPNPQLDLGVAVADFTGLNVNGGQAMYMAGGAFDFLALNQPNNVNYVAATRSSGNVYNLVPLVFFGATVSGTITTDGTTGPLAPNNVVSWNITVDELTEDAFTSANSTLVANLVDLDLAGTALTVMNPEGFLTFRKGNMGGHPHALILADFSAQAPPGGQAGYYLGAFSVTIIDLNAPLGPWVVTDTNVTAVVDAAPTVSRLGQPWPNPANPRISVALAVARPGNHRVRVIDAAGRALATLFDDLAAAGSLVLQWDGRDASGRAAPSGVYFLELTGASVDSRRFTLVR